MTQRKTLGIPPEIPPGTARQGRCEAKKKLRHSADEAMRKRGGGGGRTSKARGKSTLPETIFQIGGIDALAGVFGRLPPRDCRVQSVPASAAKWPCWHERSMLCWMLYRSATLNGARAIRSELCQPNY